MSRKFACKNGTEKANEHRLQESVRPTDVFMGILIFVMSHGLTNTAVARPPFNADAEGRQRQMGWIETQPDQQTSLA